MKAVSLSVIFACISISFPLNHDVSCKWYPVVTAKSIVYDQCMRVYRRHCSCSSIITCSKFEYKVVRVGYDTSCSNIFVWCPWESWTRSELMRRSSKCFRYSERRRRCCLQRPNRLTAAPKPYLRCQICGDCTAHARQYLTSCPNNATISQRTPTHVSKIRVSSMAVAVGLVIAVIFGVWIFIVYRRKVHHMCNRNSTTTTPPTSSITHTPNLPPSYDEAVTSMLSPPPYEVAVLSVNRPTTKLTRMSASQNGNASI